MKSIIIVIIICLQVYAQTLPSYGTNMELAIQIQDNINDYAELENITYAYAYISNSSATENEYLCQRVM